MTILIAYCCITVFAVYVREMIRTSSSIGALARKTQQRSGCAVFVSHREMSQSSPSPKAGVAARNKRVKERLAKPAWLKVSVERRGYGLVV